MVYSNLKLYDVSMNSDVVQAVVNLLHPTSGILLDNAMAVRFKGPRSFTGFGSPSMLSNPEHSKPT